MQNRVSPDGSLHKNNARGMFTGNRGIIHDPDSKTLMGRRWTTSAWICCSLEWKGCNREVWGKNFLKKSGEKATGWSELFFCDEITALAAGHRPCHTCRNKDAQRFHEAYCAGNGLADAKAKNSLLHAQRWHSAKHAPQPMAYDGLKDLPDGVMLKAGNLFYAVRKNALVPWDFSGYGKPVTFAAVNQSALYCVTPPAIVETLRQGYLPVWHPSAP